MMHLNTDFKFHDTFIFIGLTESNNLANPSHKLLQNIHNSGNAFHLISYKSNRKAYVNKEIIS